MTANNTELKYQTVGSTMLTDLTLDGTHSRIIQLNGINNNKGGIMYTMSMTTNSIELKGQTLYSDMLTDLTLDGTH